MNRDDVIRMAKEAGLETHERKGEVRIGSSVITGCDNTEQVERFAKLVAAHEREECAKVCDDEAGDYQYLKCWPAVAAAEVCAAAIRARSSP